MISSQWIQAKSQPLDANPEAIEQINFSGNLDCLAIIVMFVIYEAVKETILNFAQGNIRVLQNAFHKCIS